VAAARQNGGTAPDGNGQPGTGGAVGIGLLVLGAGGFVAARAIRQRRRVAAQLAEVKAAAHDDLIALADDVQKLEQPVEANAKAKQEYAAAIEDYGNASDAYVRASRPNQLQEVTIALEEGRYHMAAAEAILAGQ